MQNLKEQMLDHEIDALISSESDRVLLYEYLLNTNSDFINKLCNGSINLPPPSMLKGLSGDGAIARSKKILDLLTEAEVEASAFYSKLFSNDLKTLSDLKNYSMHFEHEVQRHGQSLINLLILIKSSIALEKPIDGAQNIKKAFEYVHIWVRAKSIYDNSFFQKTYFLMTTITTLLVSSILFFMVGGISNLLPAIFMSAIVIISFILVGIWFYNFNVFELSDMDGDNLLAIKYRSMSSRIDKHYQKLHIRLEGDKAFKATVTA